MTRRPSVLILAGFLVAAVLLAACGEAEPSQPGGSSGGSPEGPWVLTGGGGTGGEIPIVEGYRITLTIAAGRIDGTSACNSYSGEVAIDGSSFAVNGMGSTERGCAPNVMASEGAYMEALMAATTIERAGDELVLTGPDTELSFEALAPVPTSDLVDTEWKLESLIEGPGPDGAVSSVSRVTLILNGDGSFSGTTGCRDIEGQWVEQGDEILFATMSADGHCPRDLQAQDGHVLQVLGVDSLRRSTDTP